MNISGQFRPVATPHTDNTQPVGELLAQGLELVEELTLKLQKLDSLMLTGKPNEISEAAASVEVALNDAAPAFAEIAEAMGRLGASNLAAAAAQLRHIEQEDEAGLAEALRGALTRFAKRSVNASRRAQQLNRGLSAALRSLQALGVQEAGRLIAEA
ncbi:MAG: hypothetical protein KGQ26_03360 [Rhodospirillales bacterium]|nr:hypothetical protein [Rhodospirillales bacterium]MDE2319555.1 hypothetical protein [Rhodospirillales bacterium]